MDVYIEEREKGRGVTACRLWELRTSPTSESLPPTNHGAQVRACWPLPWQAMVPLTNHRPCIGGHPDVLKRVLARCGRARVSACACLFVLLRKQEFCVGWWGVT